MTVQPLQSHPLFTAPSGPVVLVVLDGVGLGPLDEGNAWHLARTPVIDALMALPVTGSLRAHGPAVGLPSDSDLGNSEVGHNALGAGRIFDQGAKLVQEAIVNGSLFEGRAWKELISDAQTLHLIGLWSDGNVHAHLEHGYAMIEAAIAAKVPRIRLHLLLDGRDVGPETALDYVLPLEARLSAWQAQGVDIAVASGGGRMKITMDRYEADWSMVERGWQTHVLGEGRRFASASEAILALRAEQPGIDDQNLPPFVIGDLQGPNGAIQDGDSVIFFNFRGDRALEISRAFEAPEGALPQMMRTRIPKVRYAGMMQYDGDLAIPTRFLVAPPRIEGTLGEYLARTGKRQLAISETQKFGHVTYFFNGNNSEPFDPELERYVEITSDNVDFSERPWMKAAEIVDRCLLEIDEFKPDFVRLNFPNGDMVGHTGRLFSAIVAMEAVDLSLGRLLAGLRVRGGTAIVLADHGNCEEMFERGKDGKPKPDGRGGFVEKTSHTTNPVPCIIVGPGAGERYIWQAPSDAGLTNIASTCCELLGLQAPSHFRPSVIAWKTES